MKPAYKLLVNGKPINTVDHPLIDLTLTDNRSFNADQLTFTISDPRNTLAMPRKGASIQCFLGWEIDGVMSVVDKGTFIVDDIGYDINPREMTIHSNSANFRAGLAQVKTKSYHNKTLGNIAQYIAKKHQLSLKITDRLDNIMIPHIDQNSESDGHFLTRLAQRYDAMLNIKHDTVIILSQGKGQTASGQSLGLLTINIAECESASFKDVDRDSEYTGVKAKWHDTHTGKTVWEVAGKADKAQRLKHRYPTQQEALTAAHAEWNKIQRGSKTLTINLTNGKADWITEKQVQTKGIKADIDALTWVTQRVVHKIGDDGYICSGELEQSI